MRSVVKSEFVIAQPHVFGKRQFANHFEKVRFGFGSKNGPKFSAFERERVAQQFASHEKLVDAVSLFRDEVGECVGKVAGHCEIHHVLLHRLDFLDCEKSTFVYLQ